MPHHYSPRAIGGPCTLCGRPNLEHGNGECPGSAQAAPAAVAERGVEGTGLTEAEFAQYVQQRKDFNAAPAAAQPVAREAVGHVRIDSGEVRIVPRERDAEFSPLHDGQKVYTTPPALVGLSDSALDALRQADNGALNYVTLRQFREVARAANRAMAAANGMTLREPKA